MNYIEFFHEAVRRYGEKTALVDKNGERRTSYATLDELSGRVAGKLKMLGCVKGDFVVINMDRRMEYIAAYLGILKAGCVVVPVVPDYPQERINYIRDHCDASTVITEAFFRDIETYKEFEGSADSREPALLIYTSGSTGAPKGILHSAGDIARAAVRHQVLFEGVSPIVYAATAQLSFIAHVFEYLTVFYLGGTSHILPDSVRKSATALEDYITENNITVGWIVPQMLRIFHNTAPNFQRVLAGGERMSQISEEGFSIINVYGMSESAAIVSCFHVDKAYENTPIGKALAPLEVIICDVERKTVPDGCEGEICVIGEIDTCYFRDPEATSRTMIKLSDGKTMLSTGDIGFVNENGDLVYTNRKDWMVKINGQRVEILEVETLLSGMPQIENAVVKTFEDRDGQNYLVAYYVSEKEMEESELRNGLKRKLPDYMIPRFFVHMVELPKNINGKLDRKSLLPPSVDRYKTEYIVPLGGTEKRICDAFENILHCGAVGAADDFFALGGDSIKVLRLIDAINIDGLTPDMILSGRTPNGIAALCNTDKKNMIAHSENIPDICPLTGSQLGIYLECMENTQSVKYNIPVLCRLPEGTDTARFVEAVKTVASMHKALLVTVSAPKGVPSMIFHGGEIIVEEKSAESIDIEKSIFRRPFDLENGPLYRFELLHTPEGDAFLLDIHHIIFDGASFSTLIKQIAHVYDGGECFAEALTIFDISAAEARPKDMQREQELREFFKEKLESMDCDSKPIPDQITENSLTDAGFIAMQMGDKFNFSDVSEYIKTNKITENALFLGAFGYALAKYNGAMECFFTTAYNGRFDPRLASSIGMFVKTLPFSCRFDEGMTPAELLSAVQEDYYRIKENDCISFSELAAEYSLSMDVSFVYQAELLNGVSMGEGAMNVEFLDSDNTVADLELMLLKTGRGYQLTSHYRKSQYSESFVRCFMNLYLSVVHGMMSAGTLGEIVLSDDESKRQINQFNQTEKAYDTEKTVVDLFREQAAITPDTDCLVFESKHFTYRQVDELTDRLAMHLHAMGIGKGSITGVLIPRCEYMLICSLGILKAGGAYLPLDPSYPQERLNLMMQDSAAALLITTSELSEVITEEFTGKRMTVDEIPNLENTDEEISSPTKDDLFVILYTSGSTGTPKGVMFAHSNTMVTAAWERDFYSLGVGSNVAAYASYGFDANVFDTYATITSGATLHIISDDIRLNLPALLRYFNEKGITHSVITTQVGRQFALMEGIKTLRYLNVAGEKLTPLAPPKEFNLYNLYGPTEGSILVTGFRIDRFYKDVPIGKAIDNVKLYVVDPLGRLLPAGATGELWISGPHVTQGYLNRPEKTAESYGINPFCNAPGYERIYRTGDMVRFMGDGNLQFIGRRDGQVKVRGFRVELTEVEEIIRRFEGIKDATVAAFDEPFGGKFIAAYIVADKKINIDAMNDFIRSEKPPYMVPAVTMQIDKIPLTQNQKVNRKALPRPERKVESLISPENETQQKIFDIISDVLGHSQFGIDTNLFDAGLTSIGTLKLNVMLGNEFDMSVKLDDLKQNDTVRKLEAFLSVSEKAQSYQRMADYPITETQRGIFVECSMNPDGLTYNIPLLLKLSDKIDVAKLISAVKIALAAHPYVKATLFADETGDIRACRNDDAKPTVEYNSCEKLPDRDELVRPYQLLNEPLYRASVYSTPEGNYLFLDFHHIIFDGTSEAILLSDIDKAYAGQTVEDEKYTGFEVALDEEKARVSERYTKAKEYYDSVFSGCEADCLPPKAPESDKVGAASLTKVCKGNARAVKAYCHKNNLTLNAFFNAAFGFTLAHFGQFEDVVYTTVYNGRSDSRLYSSLTMLVKTLPVLVRTGDNRKITEFIRDTQEQLMNSMSNDIYSFAEISKAYGIRSDIIFVYQGDNFTFDTLCGEPAELVDIAPNVVKAPITLIVNLREGAFELVADYRCDLYSAVFIENLLSSLEKAVMGFVEKEYIGEVSLLSKEAADRLNKINDTRRVFENVPVNLLFERHAVAYPDKIAVIGSGKQLTYGELNRLANRLAHALSELGVKKDTIVGMVLDRTVELSVVELGILKAGGAFLGMLPTYPDDRIDFCLNDAESPIVITTEAIKMARPTLFTEEKSYRTLTVEQLLTNENEDNLNLFIPTDSLAYCIYTSGSTGRPKGVMIEHHSLANCAQPADFTYSLYCGDKSGEVGLALSSISFDMSVFDHLLLLMNGKTVCIATEQEIHNPAALASLIMENRVEMIATTPSFITNYISIPEFCPALQNIKAIVVGAEAFPASLYTELKKIAPNIHIINGYGPSECTMTCCSKEIQSEKIVTIGGPAANTAFYVVDRFGNILPPYACGELIICGELVGRGYVKLPEKTKATFFTLCGMPAYRSGDTVRFNADGEVEFFGRMDNQVKLRGFRVELDEIEKCICSFDGIKQSKVIVRNNGTEDYLAGFFTADHKVDLAKLTDHLKAKLTYYMVPDVMAQLEAMPLTQNGKIDKKALPEIKKESRKSGRRAPKKSMEEQLCDLFKSVLSLEEFYADDNFFEMGGTSLSASKAVMQLMAKGINVEYQDIFDHPTPESLAAYVEAHKTVQPANDQKAEPSEALSETQELLKYNTLEYAAEVKREPLGDVLLTGAVGFLGIHVLRQLIELKEGKILCLVRKGSSSSPTNRLKNMLMYYFGDTFDGEFENRITVIDADITDDDLVSKLDSLHYDTLINCAACVKHYASDDIIEKINVHGAENLISCAKAKNAKMIQISTTSIPGVHTDETYKRQLKMHENELFVIDSMDNKYCISKYHAELKLLEAVKEGMRGKIIRVGNLMGRYSDGEFQINFNTNAFLHALRGFATLEKCPISHATDPMKFSPIDLTAKAIVLLAGTNDRFTAFHADNRFGFDEMQIIEACNGCGVKITPVDDKEYYADYYRMLGDEKINARLSGLVTNDRPNLHAVDTDNVFTANILYRLGFSWPLVDSAYLERAINSLLTLGYFDM